MLSDQEKYWLELLKTDDEKAMQLIFEAYYKYLVVTAYNLLDDDGRARDLAQDILFDFWQKRENLNIDFSLKAFLRKALVNRCIDEIRRRKSKKIDVLEEQQLERLDVGHFNDKLEEDDLKLILNQTIDRLPEKCRLVFKLSRFENLSHKEIAQQLDISTKTIENQITKALKHIRKSLEQYGKVIIWFLILFAFY